MRSYALTIAGLDPSGGAGLTADVKTFEQYRVYGLSVCSAITLQTEDEFYDLRWENLEDIIRATGVLLDKYPVAAVKTGILPSLEYLNEIVSFISAKNKSIRIVIDPVFTSSTGFDFLKDFNRDLFYSILKKCTLVTPNTMEAVKISGIENEEAAAADMARHCEVLLKGGHSERNPGTDFLYTGGGVTGLAPATTAASAKHGSGCILSAAITAGLALGRTTTDACRLAKVYVEKVLSSNNSLLAYHHVS